MKIQVLTENRATKRGYLAEHGLSLFIHHDAGDILFDTGQTDVYLKNAEFMGVDVKKADCIVLSHSHYDHTGGLAFFPETDHFPKVYVHKDAFLNYYAKNKGGNTYREIGIPWSPDDHSLIKNNIVYTGNVSKIGAGITLVGDIPHTVSFEQMAEDLLVGSENGMVQDRMNHEQVLIFDRPEGLTVILGCSHPGVVNCLSHVASLFPGKKIFAVVGGMHLGDVSSMRLQMTIQSFLDLDIKKVVPMHCTGILAICEMKRQLKDRCIVSCAGDTIDL